jgi:hypothetical protein
MNKVWKMVVLLQLYFYELNCHISKATSKKALIRYESLFFIVVVPLLGVSAKQVSTFYL